MLIFLLIYEHFNIKNMLNAQHLESVFKLAGMSNDRIIILLENHEPLVLMNLANYQALVAKPSSKPVVNQQLALDNINQDIALFHANQVEVPPVLDDYNLEQFKVEDQSKPVLGNQAAATNPAVQLEEEEKYYLEPVD